MVSLLISLLILAIVVVVVLYIIDLLGLPHPIPLIAKLVIGLVALICILQIVLPLLGGTRLRLSDAATYQMAQFASPGFEHLRST